jgi:hypothetical protein
MSKMSGDTARANRLRAQRNVNRVKMRELRAAIEARKAPPIPAVEKPAA